MPTTWSADWYNLWYNQSLHHTLDFTRHNKIMLKTQEDDHNTESSTIFIIAHSYMTVWQ